MLEFVLNFLFPKTCVICGKLDKNYICEKCEERFNKYKRYGIIDNKKTLMDKLNIHNITYSQYYSFAQGQKLYWEKLLYCFEYKSIIRKYILKYKFGNKPYLSEFFANQILNNKKVYEILKLYDIIISVPMEKIKKQKRGYNQTELIAKIIAKKCAILYEEDLIKKVKDTKTQSTLNKKERVNNIKDAYQITDKSKVYRKKIILFDDIYTSGATVNEISKKLKQAGAREVLVLVIAKD